MKVNHSIITTVHLPIGNCTVSLTKESIRFILKKNKRKFIQSISWDSLNSEFENQIKNYN